MSKGFLIAPVVELKTQWALFLQMLKQEIQMHIDDPDEQEQVLDVVASFPKDIEDMPYDEIIQHLNYFKHYDCPIIVEDTLYVGHSNTFYSNSQCLAYALNYLDGVTEVKTWS